MLAIVETLKEFRNILLGQRIRIYTDHKNLTYKNFNTERVMRWRLILEEYNPELNYTKGTTNIIADALSRLDMDEKQHLSIYNYPLFYGSKSDDLDVNLFPLDFSTIAEMQHADSQLCKLLQSHNDYSMQSFHGGNKTYELICLHDKIVIPQPLQRRIVQWYHEQLCYPGENRTEETICQHFTWQNLQNTVRQLCGKCHVCQLCKKDIL